MNQREQFLDRVSERLPQARQLRAFRWGGLDAPQPGSENGVLRFQLSDLPQHDGLRHVDQENEEWI